MACKKQWAGTARGVKVVEGGAIQDKATAVWYSGFPSRPTSRRDRVD